MEQAQEYKDNYERHGAGLKGYCTMSLYCKTLGKC